MLKLVKMRIGRISPTSSRSSALIMNSPNSNFTRLKILHALHNRAGHPEILNPSLKLTKESFTKNVNVNNKALHYNGNSDEPPRKTATHETIAIFTVDKKKPLQDEAVVKLHILALKDVRLHEESAEKAELNKLSTKNKKLIIAPKTPPNSVQPYSPPQTELKPVQAQEKTSFQWREIQPFSFSTYLSLSKLKLSAFITLTAMTGYAMAPATLDITRLALMTIGTFLCALSANSFNQWLESPFDSQMARTRLRPLARHLLSQSHAFFFATTTGIVGVLTLLTVNAVISLLGLLNIVLYAAIYTPLKRISIINTWIGSIVGAIPPIMGWGATGDFTSSGAYIIAALLFAWQFPHFCSLSWMYRADYARAGYKMMSVLNPKLNSRVSLRYSLSILLIVALSCYTGLTTNYFFIDGGLSTLYITFYAFLFWNNPNVNTARSLFFSSLIHLPIIVILMMFHKISPSYNLDEPNQDDDQQKTLD